MVLDTLRNVFSKVKDAFGKVSSKLDGIRDWLDVKREWWETTEPREKYQKFDEAAIELGKDWKIGRRKAEGRLHDILHTDYEDLKPYEKEIYHIVSP